MGSPRVRWKRAIYCAERGGICFCSIRRIGPIRENLILRIRHESAMYRSRRQRLAPILAELQRDSRQTVQQLAAAVGLSSHAVLEARQGDGGRRRDPRLHGAWSTARRSASHLVRAGRGQPDRHNETHGARVRARRRRLPADRQLLSARPARPTTCITVLVPDIKQLREIPARHRVQAAGRDARALERRAEGSEGRGRRADRRRRAGAAAGAGKGGRVRA